MMYWNASFSACSMYLLSLTDTYDVLKYNSYDLEMQFLDCLTDTYDVLKCIFYT